jgi:hypothetical protein
MNKSQALHQFWSGFGIPAWDENTVPEDDAIRGEKYIAYSVSTGSLDDVINLTAKIWDTNTTSWSFVESKAAEIAEHIARMVPPTIPIDNGRLYITEGRPFSQRIPNPDDLVRGVYINIQAEFLTAY